MSSLSGKLYYSYLIITVCIFAYCYSNEYGGIPAYLLPLSYAFTLVVCRSLKDKFSSLSVAIMNSVCLVRYAFYPLSLVLDKSTGAYYSPISVEALYLMAYEVIVVQLFLNFYVSRLDNARTVDHTTYKKTAIGPLNKTLMFLVVPIVLVFPSLLSIFRFLGVERGSAPGLVGVIFEMGVYVVYVYVLSFWSKRENLFSFIMSVLCCVGYIFITMVSGENVRRWLFLWIGIPTISVLLEAYPKYKGSIKTIALVGIPLGIFFGSFAKFAVTNVSLLDFYSNFLGSDSLSDYFGGLNCLSYTINTLPSDPKAITFTSTLTDLFGNMPLVSRFFNVDAFSTQFIFLDMIGRTDLICPLLGQSYVHFGFLGAPIFSIVMALIAVECNVYIKRSRNIYELYGLTMMCVIFSLYMCLNTMILLTHAWTLVIFLIIQYYNNKFLYKKS